MRLTTIIILSAIFLSGGLFLPAIGQMDTEVMVNLSKVKDIHAPKHPAIRVEISGPTTIETGQTILVSAVITNISSTPIPSPAIKGAKGLAGGFLYGIYDPAGRPLPNKPVLARDYRGIDETSNAQSRSDFSNAVHPL